MNLYLRFKKEDIHSFLKSVRGVLKDTPEAYSRSIHLEPIPGKNSCFFHINTGEYRIRKEIATTHKDNFINIPVVIEFKSLLALVEACDKEHFAIFQSTDNKLNTPLHGGTVSIQNYRRLVSKIDSDSSFFSVLDSKFSFFDGNQFSEFLKSAQKVFSFCNDAKFKKLSIKNNKAVFNFLYTAAIFENVPFPDMVVRMIDIPLLQKLCVGESQVSVASFGSYFFFRTPTVNFAIPKIKSADIETILKVFPEIPVIHAIEVPEKKFSQLSKLIKGAIRGVGLITFEVKTRCLFVKVQSRTGGFMEFPLNESVSDIRFEAKCSTEFFGRSSSFVSSECGRTKQDVFHIGVDKHGSVHLLVDQAHVVAGHIS